VSPRAGSVPGNHGLWFHNDQGIAPCKPKPVNRNPKQPISLCQSGTRIITLEHEKLLAQSHDFQTEAISGTEKCTQGTGRIVYASFC
jgi:hypothetical protein